MGTIEFTLPKSEQSTQQSSSDLARRIGEALARARFNGKSDGVIAHLDIGTIVVISENKYQHGYEVSSGNFHLADVYIHEHEGIKTLRVDVFGDAPAAEYLARHL